MNDFYGLPVGILENESLRLEYLKTAGPRIVRLTLPGKPNLLAEIPDAALETPLGPYYFRGGHRLWCGPESIPGTYIPDNDSVEVKEFPGGVRLTGRAEPGTGIVKSIELRLAPEQVAVTVQHELFNNGVRPVELAPWALSMLRLGGTAILPQPRGNPGSAQGWLHNRILALWPYTQINDPRMILGDDFSLVQATPSRYHAKIGYFNTSGWMAYWLEGILFRKTFAVDVQSSYPDRGCNVEVYCDENVIELETFGALGRLEPGKAFIHTETWELFESLAQNFIPADLRARLER
jgi:hypothetical protein